MERNIYFSEETAEAPFNPLAQGAYQMAGSRLDLNEYLLNNSSDTFLIRVTGDSMKGAGILPGNMLLVDRAKEPGNNKIVVAAINDKLLVKRLKITPDSVFLISENPEFEPIEVKRSDKFEIWGVVASVIKSI